MLNKYQNIKKLISNIFPKPQSDSLEWEMTPKDCGALLIASFGAFMALLDIQVTNSSLREIQTILGIDMTEVGWISTAYLIAEIMVIPLAPILVDTLGLGYYLIAFSILFAITSILCAFSWNLLSLTLFRLLQGLAGGGLIPVILQMILIYMPSHRRPIGLAIFGLIATLAPSIGPSIGGLLTTHFGWQSIFLVNLIPSIIIAYSTSKFYPPSFPSWTVFKNSDWTGAAFLCSGVGSLTFILEEGSNRGWFQDKIIIFCSVLSLIAFPCFVIWEQRQKKPLIHLDLFQERSFTVSVIVTFLAAQCLYGGMYALSVFLGGIRGYTPIEIGSILSWAGIPQIFVIPFIPWLMKRVDPRFMAICGLILFSMSNWLNTGLHEDYGTREFRWSLIWRAISQPFFTIPLSALAIQKIIPSRAGAASSIINMTRNLGGSVGIATVSFILKNHTQIYVSYLSDSMTIASLDIQTIKQAVKFGLWFWGMDPSEADAVTTLFLNTKVLREAYFHCFIEVFTLLFMELIFAALLIFFIPFSQEQMKNQGHSLH
jgi:MFS transporter, DHA2 family, multidrug resistance protein